MSSALSLARRLGARAGELGGVVSAVVVLTFALIHLVPGDPAVTILGPRATPESLAALRAELGVGTPLLQQFGSFLADLAHGDLGASIAQHGRPVTDIIVPSLGVTLSVVALTAIMSMVIGIVAGLLAALSPWRWVDHVVRGFTLVLLATPTFFLGLVLLLGISLQAGLAPAGGWGMGWPENLRYLWLPSLCLSGYLAPVIARTVRQSARATLAESYVEAAIARGLPSRTVALRHVLPNSMLPVITLVGFNVAALLGGTAVLEAVFALPGIGTQLVTAVGSRDYPVVQGVALVAALLVVLVNGLTDVLQVVADPRARHGS